MGATPNKVLICKNCETELSKPVLIDPIEIGPHNTGVNGRFLAEQGHAKTVLMDFSANHYYDSHLFHHRDKKIRQSRIWMNYADVEDFVILEKTRNTGCCGPDGNLNSQCKCGNFIGRDYRDCLISKFFSPEPDQTEWIDSELNHELRQLNFITRMGNPDRRKHTGLFLQDIEKNLLYKISSLKVT